MTTQQADQQVLPDALPTDEGNAPLESTPLLEGEVPADVSVAAEVASEIPVAPEAAPEVPPAEPASASPYEVPPELRAPPLSAPTTVIPENVIKELEYLRNRDQYWAQVEASQQEEQGIRQYQQHYESLNYDSETARVMANIHRTERAEAQKVVQQERQTSQLQGLRQEAAEKVAREHNVRAMDVMAGASPEDMVWRANAINYMGGQDKTIAGLTKRLEAVEKRQVPEQSFVTSNGTGGATVTADTIDALYVAEENRIQVSANPNQLNRFETQYRAFLGRQ